MVKYLLMNKGSAIQLRNQLRKKVEEVTINIAKNASVNDIVFYTKKCHIILEGNAKYNGEKKDGMQFTHVNAPKSHAYA